MSLNCIHLIGNLGADPEIKSTASGMTICTLSLATAHKLKDGEEKTSWHRVKLFGRLGEIAGEYLKKGRQVYIQGRIEYSDYTGSDGVKKYFTDIVADEMKLLGGREDGGGERSQSRPQEGGSRSAPPRREAAPRRAAPPPADDFADDDIPFN